MFRRGISSDSEESDIERDEREWERYKLKERKEAQIEEKNRALLRQQNQKKNYNSVGKPQIDNATLKPAFKMSIVSKLKPALVIAFLVITLLYFTAPSFVKNPPTTLFGLSEVSLVHVLLIGLATGIISFVSLIIFEK